MKDKTRIGAEVAIVVTVLSVVIVLMRFESLRFACWESSIFIGIPLVAAIALNLPLTELGLVFRKPLTDLKFFGLACLIFLPAFVAGYYFYAWDAQLVVRLPGGLGKIVAIHFLYHALPEELLFRGYLQKRLGRILPRVFKFLGFELPLAGVVCAALFAAAHVAYEANAYRLLVFFPALVFAWLRHRTDSILAPTLFHGTCNVAACVVGGMFAYVE